MIKHIKQDYKDLEELKEELYYERIRFNNYVKQKREEVERTLKGVFKEQAMESIKDMIEKKEKKLNEKEKAVDDIQDELGRIEQNIEKNKLIDYEILEKEDGSKTVIACILDTVGLGIKYIFNPYKNDKGEHNYFGKFGFTRDTALLIIDIIREAYYDGELVDFELPQLKESDNGLIELKVSQKYGVGVFNAKEDFTSDKVIYDKYNYDLEIVIKISKFDNNPRIYLKNVRPRLNELKTFYSSKFFGKE